MTAGPFRRAANALRSLLPAVLWNFLRAAMTALGTPLRFSAKTGHFRSSFAGAAVTADGRPLPWYTYPAIDFLAARDFSDRAVLEFGGGQSTLWWQERARSVLTFESDPRWEARIAARRTANVELRHMPIELPDEECLADIARLLGDRKFDLVILDGHLRRELVTVAFDYLAPGGAIVLDDAEGYDVHGEIQWRDCRRIDFFGFSPGVTLRHCTSLVYVGDCFLLRPDVRMPSHEEIA